MENINESWDFVKQKFKVKAEKITRITKAQLRQQVINYKVYYGHDSVAKWLDGIHDTMRRAEVNANDEFVQELIIKKLNYNLQEKVRVKINVWRSGMDGNEFQVNAQGKLMKIGEKQLEWDKLVELVVIRSA